MGGFDRGLAVTGFERSRTCRHVSAGDMGMQIERVTLRQIRMPLVHFFETSFGRTYERDIILVEVAGEGVSGWGEVTAGENPFYNEEWTESAWLILRDYAAPRVLGRDLAERRRRLRRSPRTSAATTWRAAAWKPPCGIWKRASHGVPLWRTHRRRRAARNSLRRFHRHSGFGGAAARENRARTGRRLSAHQDEDQARLGCGCGPRRCASAFPRSS